MKGIRKAYWADRPLYFRPTFIHYYSTKLLVLFRPASSDVAVFSIISDPSRDARTPVGVRQPRAATVCQYQNSFVRCSKIAKSGHSDCPAFLWQKFGSLEGLALTKIVAAEKIAKDPWIPAAHPFFAGWRALPTHWVLGCVRVLLGCAEAY